MMYTTIYDCPEFADEVGEDDPPPSYLAIMTPFDDPRRPGSNLAIEAGCTCSALKNQHGIGMKEYAMRPTYRIVYGCQIHDAEAEDE